MNCCKFGISPLSNKENSIFDTNIENNYYFARERKLYY